MLAALFSLMILAAPPVPYLAQKTPGKVPERFAPELISSALPSRDMAISPDAQRMCFSVYTAGFVHAAILESTWIDGRWTQPEVASFCRDSRFRSIEPCWSQDGKQLYFASDRPAEVGGKPGHFGIWTVERTEKGWGEPQRLGPEIQGDGMAFFPSLTRNGSLYFTREEKNGQNFIYRARKKNGRFLPAEKLPETVNSGKSRYNAFVDPDERYLIVPMFGRSDSLGGTDYYLVARDEQDRWSEALHLGNLVNTKDNDEYSPYVTPDGRYFFFMSVRNAGGPLPPQQSLSYQNLQEWQRQHGTKNPGIYWMEASFLEELRKKAIFKAQ